MANIQQNDRQMVVYPVDAINELMVFWIRI